MGFGTNIVCELFPHIHTEGFHCVGQGHVIFAMNLHAVCQPNTMLICSDIVVNLHRVLCVKALMMKLVHINSEHIANNASLNIFIVCPKDKPVIPHTARVTILYPTFLSYMVWGWDRCLTRLVHHPWEGLGWGGSSCGWSITLRGAAGGSPRGVGG